MIGAIMIGEHIQAWRLSRRLSVSGLAQKAAVEEAAIEAVEAGQLDPPLSFLKQVAVGLGIPASWLFTDPKHHEWLADDDEGDHETDGQDGGSAGNSPDPVVDRILRGSRLDRSLYVLLTAVLQSGDPKLLRAAEVSLKSLAKQSKQPSLPWQNRQPGNFEPPSD